MQTVSGGRLLAGRYKVGSLIGRGGMAEVYDGFDERLGRPVAVKVLRPEMAAQPDVRTRFDAEARAAARLTHRNVVAVFDTGEDDGVPFIVMERLPGETLADRMAAGPLDAEWMRRVAGDVLGALGAAHRAGLVHRDVKPGNVLIASDGCAKVADFGIAKSLEDTAVDLTGTSQVVGTPAYLAPERVDGLPASPRSDLYGVGVLLYEGLAGTKPFGGTTPLTVAYAVRHLDPARLTDLRPDVPSDLAAAVERAMEREPGRRFATAEEMAAAIGVAGVEERRPGPGEEETARVPVPVLPPGDAGNDTAPLPLDRTVARAEAPPSWPAGDRAPAAWRAAARRRPALLGVLLAVAAALALAAVVAGGQVGAPARTSPVSESLRGLAQRMGPDDGTRGNEVAERLRRVAEAVDAGGGAHAANALLTDVAAWRASGELSEGAAAAVTTALLAVPGTVAPVPTTSAPAPVTTVPPPEDQAGGSDDGDHGDEGEGQRGRGGKGKGKKD